ncbi:MAG: PBP1A family penicillin-binding protein [Desulfococcaceae bacterium]|jgi:penicillin-binding protein 1A|nr:PBP1A family penicillin-binding protein [Desulfococcaceae bacterium]
MLIQFFSRFSSRFFKIFLLGAGLLAFAVICALLVGVSIFLHYSEGLPQISTLKDYRPPGITRVFSDDKRLIAEFYKERRIVTPLTDIPQMLINAFVAAEDSRFFQHEGVDILSIIRAALKNMEAGTEVQGGSTITQQVCKSFLLTPEKSYERKIKEAILARRIDSAFTKEEILFLYLNHIYLGHGAYGVAAAADNYFGKTLSELNLAECAMLAGLPQAPGKYSPYLNMEKAVHRQKYVLNRMIAESYITQEEADAALKQPLEIKARKNIFIASVPYYTEHVRRYVLDKYGEDALYTGGLKIYTAVNIEMQAAARNAIDRGLRALDRRHSGYRGPEENLLPEEMEKHLRKLAEEQAVLQKGEIAGAVVLETDSKNALVSLGAEKGNLKLSAVRWNRGTAGKFSAGDRIWVKLKGKSDSLWDLAIEQQPPAQAALICIESGSGMVKAMVGGRDFRNSQFNRAVQSRRQPGSAFKPVVYAAALDKGYTPATEIIDNVFIYRDANMVWKPKNYDRKIYGPTLMRKALAKSRNLSTIQILDDIGIEYVIDYAYKLGIRSKLSPNLSIALGSSGVSLLELTNVYAVFANLGERVEPVFITKITDRDGNVLETAAPRHEQVIEKTTAYLMTSLLESVVKEGTARNILALHRPAAGKTGTTNNLHDAWFVGFTPDYITGTWVGHDQERSLGSKESGGRAASPIWLDFMKQIHKGLPVRDFKVPKGIVFSKIDAETGLLPAADSRKVIFECFKAGTVPTRYSRSAESVREKDQFFKMDM